jgi:hypothetical protein
MNKLGFGETGFFGPLNEFAKRIIESTLSFKHHIDAHFKSKQVLLPLFVDHILNSHKSAALLDSFKSLLNQNFFLL